MRRNAAAAIALAIIVAALSWSWASAEGPIQGVRVVPVKQFNELEARVTTLEGKVAELGSAPEPTPTEDPAPVEEPTEAPTPTPTPEPTEDPTPSPDPEPAPAGDFPTRDSVGPAVEPTEVYAGGCYFGTDKNGTVIDGKILDCDDQGGVRFAEGVQNVVIKNSIVRGQMLTLGSWAHDDQYPRVPTFTVLDSKIIQSVTDATQARGINGAHYVVKRSLIQAHQSGYYAHNNVILEGNYITTDGTGTHQSGGRMLKNSVLRGNTITCKPTQAGTANSGCSAHAVFYRERLDGTNVPAYNLTIEGNYFKRGKTDAGEDGGPYFAVRFIDCASWTDCTGIKFTGNQFSIGEGTDAGEFPAYADNVWADNTWTDGQPATSGQIR